MKMCKIGSLNTTVVGSFDVRICNDLTPKTGDLMCIVNLHYVELLDNLSVDGQLLLLEFRNHLFTKVNSDDIMERV